MDADHANDHLFDTTPTNSPPRPHQQTMGNGDHLRFYEHEARGKENGASTESVQGSSRDEIYEDIEDDDRDDDDDDERYEHEFEFENSERGSYGASGHGGWD